MNVRRRRRWAALLAASADEDVATRVVSGGGSGTSPTYSDPFAGASIDPRWTTWRGTWSIASGGLRNTALAGDGTVPRSSIAYEHVYSDAAGPSASVVLLDASIQQHMVLCHAVYAAGTVSGYAMRAQNATTYQLIRLDAGVVTSLATIAAVPADGDTIRIQRNASGQVRGGVNAAWTSWISDATYTGGRVGLGSQALNRDFDDFAVALYSEA